MFRRLLRSIARQIRRVIARSVRRPQQQPPSRSSAPARVARPIGKPATANRPSLAPIADRRTAISRRPSTPRAPANHRGGRPVPSVVIDLSTPKGIGLSAPEPDCRPQQRKAPVAVALPSGGVIALSPPGVAHDAERLAKRNQALGDGIDGYIKERKWDAFAIAWCDAYPTRADLLRAEGKPVVPKDERTPPTAADLSRSMATLHNAHFPNDRKDAKNSFYTPARRLFARYHKAGKPEAVEGVVEQIELDKARLRIARERQRQAQPTASNTKKTAGVDSTSEVVVEEPWINALLREPPRYLEWFEFYLSGFRHSIYWDGPGTYARRTDIRGPGKFCKIATGTRTQAKNVAIREFTEKPPEGGSL